MVLLDLGLAVEEKPGLTKVIKKARTSFTHFAGVNPFRKAGKAAHIHSSLKGAASAQAIWFVAGLTLIDCLSHVTVALIIMKRRDGSIDWDFMKIRSAQANQL